MSHLLTLLSSLVFVLLLLGGTASDLMISGQLVPEMNSITFDDPNYNQNPLDSTFYCGIQKVYPSFSLTRDELEAAETLIDLNSRYEEEWIAQYFSVTISTWHGGVETLTESKNDTLTVAQRQYLLSADSGTLIGVSVVYLPDNSLKVNAKKVLDFDCFVEPERAATFDSDQSLDAYLQEHLVSSMSDTMLQGYDLGAYTFRIDVNGHLRDPQVKWSSGNTLLDSMSIEVLCSMPQWQPAQYRTGKRIPEENVLLIGNRQNCMRYTLNLAENRLPKE